MAGSAIVTTVTSLPADAAFDTFPYETLFEIDGDAQGPNDWLAPYPALQDVSPVHEVCNDNIAIDPDTGEEVTSDANRVVQGTKIDDIADFGAVPINSGNVPRKTDLCDVYSAWELVYVPTDVNDLSLGGQYHFILYGAWSRPSVQGEIDVLFPLLGSKSTTLDDDLILSYDFVDSSDLTNFEVLRWNGSTWAPIVLPANSFEAVTTRDVEVLATNPNQELTFGEFALDLTVAGILPENGPCFTLGIGDPMSRTGNSSNSTLEDIVDAAPTVLTQCSSLTINKVARPTPATPIDFDYSVYQQDRAVLRFENDVTRTRLDGVLNVRTTPSVTYDNLLISPDYIVEETALPSGWSEQSLICESYDPILDADVTATLWTNFDNGPDSSFPLAPGVTAVCEIVNVGPPVVTLSKISLGKAGGPFPFSIEHSGELVINHDITTTTAGVATTPDRFTVAAGGVTVQELASGPGFRPVGMSCTVTDVSGVSGAVGVRAQDGVLPPITRVLEAGSVMDCVATNEALATATVSKTVEGVVAEWSVDFTIDPAPPVPQTATITATEASPTVRWVDLPPGAAYTISEGPVVTEGGELFQNGTVDCGAGAGTFTPTSGQDVTCTVTNTQLATVDVTKSVNPASATGWSVDFTIAPVPAGEVATKAATASDPTVSWEGLVPGTAYTVSEGTTTGPAGTSFQNGAIACAGTGATFTPTAGQAVACSVTNTELGSISVTKSVTNPDDAWSFQFSLAPAGTNSDPKTVSDSASTATWADLAPGAYVLTEVNVPAAYEAGIIVCGDQSVSATVGATIEVGAGQDITCTATNTRRTGDVQVVKTASVTSILSGNSFSFTLEVTNNGPFAAENVVVIDLVPSSLTIVSVAGAAPFTCSTVGNNVVCSAPSLAVAQTSMITINVAVPASTPGGARIVNVANVTSSTPDNNPVNNVSSDDITTVVVVSEAPPVILPPTGSDSHVVLLVAMLMLLLGTPLLLGARRRET